MKIFRGKVNAIFLLISMVVFTIPTFATIYEDAEDNATTGWTIHNDTTGATVENVEDTERGSRVIKLTGNGKNTEYHLGNLGGRASHIGAWKNKVERQLQWSMKYDESFMVIVSLLTEKGNKYLVYTNQSEDNKSKIRGGKVRYGLGADSANGEWHTFTRDLEADWNAFMPDEPFVAVNGFFIRGSGRVDDISLIKHIYEDAEDNATTGWAIHGDTTGVAIENVEDTQRGNRVIQLTGNERNTEYRLGNLGGRTSYVGAWNNQTERQIEWSMKYDESFMVLVSLLTKNGNHFLAYTNEGKDKKGKIRGGKIRYGLGEDSADGTWHTFSRDLDADWNAFEPDNPIVSVNGFFIRGSGRVDDISLSMVEDIEEENQTVVTHSYVDANNSLEVEEIEDGKVVIAIPTFNSVGITVGSKYDDNNDSNCTIKYKKISDSDDEWKDGLPLRFVKSQRMIKNDENWSKERNYTAYAKIYTNKRHYRGSLVNLAPNTEYEYEINITDPDGINSEENSNLILTGKFKTWSEDFHVGQTIPIHAEDLNLTKKYNDSYDDIQKVPTAAYTITDSGSEEDGYIVYTFPEIDVDNNRSVGIFIDNGVHHVIVKGATIKNASVHGIMIGTKIGKSVHDIVIENFDISGWGREANKTEVNRYCENPEDGQLNWSPEWGKNSDSGIFVNNLNAKKIIIQRNTIHDPRYRSNSWLEQHGCKRYTHTDQYHPAGPKGISFGDYTKGNHVIRYNHIHANENNNSFDDIMGGSLNKSTKGFPRNDTDIYGNILEDAWDDGIESEGRNENCRIWGNYIQDTYKAIATRATNYGPIYIWRNVVLIGKRGSNTVADSGFHKAGGEKYTGDEGVYVFHNTVTLPNNSNIDDYLESSGISGSLLYTKTANNILNVAEPIYSERANHSTRGAPGSYRENYFSHDLVPPKWKTEHAKHFEELGTYSAEFNVTLGEPEFVDNFGLQDDNKTGIFTTSIDWVDKGLLIPNFNDNHEGNAPDLGAHEEGTPLMEFGPNAYIE